MILINVKESRMDDVKKASTIVQEGMMKQDAFSQWLGIEILDVSPGYCRLQARITKDMLNGFGICHGGVLFSLADSALAFASNGHGRHALSIDTSLAIYHSAVAGDLIIAEASEINRSHHIGHYQVKLVEVAKQIGLFQGIVYFKTKEWNLQD